ncbi:Spore germination protein B3 [bioreactor metagenome]|uniref:Spore germination protein B3 n=1 Tax=bioreactor metagenome TaxID=1076179 RepID=A0A645AUA7_9ZZZZ
MMLSLGGCKNNNRDINSLAVVTAIGIDKAADGKIEFTVQIIGPTQKSESQAQMSSGSSGGGGNKAISATSEGSTTFEAVRNIIPKLSKKIYFSHLQVLVIGEDLAKEGLDQFWDFFERDHEVSRQFRVIVAKGGTAKSIIEATPMIEQLSGVEITDTIDNAAYGKNIKIRGYEVSELLSEPLAGLVTGAIDSGGAKILTDMQVEGGAVFKNARLVGYLDDEEARGYLFASNKMKSTILTIANPCERGNLVSIEVIDSSGKLKTDIKNGKLRFTVEIKASGNIVDEQGSADLSSVENVKKLEQESEVLISSNIKALLEKSQKTFGSDILNFSDLFYKHHYKDYQKIVGSWDKLYEDADIDVKVQFTIKRSGMITKPAYEQSISNG